MKSQNFKNHVRMHPIYHYIGAPLVTVVFIATLVNLIMAIYSGEGILTALLWLAITLGLFITFSLVRLYSTKLQDRIIRSEENLRHYTLTNTMLNSRLTIQQIIALRFASDDEFPALCERTIKENLQPKDIKKAVKHWRGDYYRV
ncbi:DUF6526 family protein [Cytobacillus sp. Hm23]